MSRKNIPAFVRNLIILVIAAAVLAGFALIINSRTATVEGSGRVKEFSTLSVDGAEDTRDEPFTVAENSGIRMILDPATLGITLEDKATGEVMTSTHGLEEDRLNTSWRGFLGSGVSIEYYSGTSPVIQRADLINQSPQMFIEENGSGFRATLVFDSLEIALDVIVELTDSGMHVRVPADSLYEGEQFRLSGVYLYPFLGASRLGEEAGYMLIPEGSGALIDLAYNGGRYSSPYIRKIYGNNIALDSQISQDFNFPSVEDPAAVSMPIYGIAHTDKQLAVLGIAEEGRSNAQVLAYPNGVSTDYNWAAVKFLYREDYVTQMSRSTGVRAAPVGGDFRDVSMRFELLSGETADYVGMAHTYQDYLLANGTLAEKDSEFNVRVDLLGAESKDWIIFDTVVSMTTVEQMEAILDDLLASGVENMLPGYKGWQPKGLSRSYGSGLFSLESKLGSRDALMSLIEKYQALGIDLSLYQDFLLANPKGNYNTSTDVVKGMSRNVAELLTNQQLYPSYYYLTPAEIASQAEGFADTFKDTPLKVAAVDGITNNLFSYYDQGVTVPRGDTSAQIGQVMQKLDTLDLALSSPFDYLWSYADHYLDLPVYATNYNYISAEVPFLPIVLKGYLPYYAPYMNFEANASHFALKMAEYGTFPSFLLTHEDTTELKETNSSNIFTSQYEDYKPAIVEYYERFGELSSRTAGAQIIDHEIQLDDVVSVTYSNGIRIVINYSSNPYLLEDRTIEPMSYEIVEVNP